MLPPCIHGGAEFHLPADSGGATPMEPKKGWSGMVMPGAKAAVIAVRLRGMILLWP